MTLPEWGRKVLLLAIIPVPLYRASKGKHSQQPTMPYHPALTSSFVHHSSHQLTALFSSEYNVTEMTINRAEKWRRAIIYYPYFNWNATEKWVLLIYIELCDMPEFTIVIFIHYKTRIAVAILDLLWMKMIWCGLKIKENYHLLENQFHWNFHSKSLCCRKIKSVFRDVKLCFNASWGLKALSQIGHYTLESLRLSSFPISIRKVTVGWNFYNNGNVS